MELSDGEVGTAIFRALESLGEMAAASQLYAKVAQMSERH